LAEKEEKKRFKINRRATFPHFEEGRVEGQDVMIEYFDSKDSMTYQVTIPAEDASPAKIQEAVKQDAAERDKIVGMRF
jgi:hypothetical protein